MSEVDGDLQGGSPGVQPWSILCGVVVAYVAFNSLVFWRFSLDSPHEIVLALVVGVWGFEPMALAAWAALGPGHFALRLSIVVPCLVFMIGSFGLIEGSFRTVQLRDFLALTTAGLIVSTTTTLLLLLVRRIARLRVDRMSERSETTLPRTQFSTKYLLTLTTICAAAIASVSSLNFIPTRPMLYFGPNFVFLVAAIASGAILFLLLPIVTFLLLLLHPATSKRAWRLAVVFWGLVTIASTGAWVAIEDGESILATISFMLLTQFGAAIIGVLTILPLRLVGYRLLRSIPSPSC